MEIIKGHCAKILDLAYRNVNTKTGTRKIAVISLENVPYKTEIWDNDSIFANLQVGYYLCVKDGLIYEKKNEGYDPTLAVKMNSVLVVSKNPIGKIYTANQPEKTAEPALIPIPKTFESEIRTPQQESALLTILDEIRQELRLIRRVWEERLEFKQPKLEDVVDGE